MLEPMGLCLSVEKTRVCHIDEGFDFLGWRIQRRDQPSQTGHKAVYTFSSKKSLASIIAKIRLLTRREKHRTLTDLLRRLNPVLRGWCNCFKHGVSKRTFRYVDHYVFLAGVLVAEETTRWFECTHHGPPLSSRLGSQQRRNRHVPT